MGDSNVHNHKRCPLFLAGHAAAQLKGNVHVQGGRRYADGERDADGRALRSASTWRASATAPVRSIYQATASGGNG